MYSSFQRQILHILAQQQATPAAPNTKSGPTSVAGSPTAFDPFAYYPTMITAWGSNNLTPIRQLSHILNIAIYVLSSGALDMNRLRGNNFNIDTSQYPDIVLRGMLNYALQVYRTVYSNFTAPFTAPLKDKAQRVQKLHNLLTTFQIPDGGINTFLNSKLGGNLKTFILDTLALIK